MVRLIFWAVVLFGLAALVSSAYLRFELAQPGISGLSTALAGDATGQLFNAILVLHGVINAVLLALFGAFAGFVAAAKGFRIGLISGWAGIGAALFLTAVQIGLIYFPDVTAMVGLYPPTLGGGVEQNVSWWPPLESLQSSLGLTVCFGGAAALLGSGQKRQLAALAITVVGWGVLVWFLRPAGQVPVLPDISAFLVPAAGVCGLALFNLRQQTASAILLCAGAAALVVSLLYVRSMNVGQIDTVYQDTYYVVAHFHFLMGLFGLFTLLAALVTWAQPRLPGWMIPGLAAPLVIGQIATFAPQFLLGRQGMPRRYIDYPDAFALWNLISSIGALVMFLALITMLALIWVRRTR